ncbi:hypothetical protein G6F52_014020 [Rhizopus delemar]|nr:hypothetical protein G6F52_014020 [Rhizopus delemar]
MSFTDGNLGRNAPAAKAAAHAPATSASTNTPLFDSSMRLTTAAQPANVSNPSRRSGSQPVPAAAVRAKLPNSAVTPKGAMRR